MAFFLSSFLGLVQGLTEFLPVSSSAHLVLAAAFFRFGAQSMYFDAFLHFGTLLALIVFFAPRIGQIVAGLFAPRTRPVEFRLFLLLVLGTIPAAIAGIAFQSRLEKLFLEPEWAAVFLVMTGFFLFATRSAFPRRATVNWQDALIIGCAQAVALLPGISRSGITVSAALLLGLSAPVAFEFSMLLSIPAVFGAVLASLPKGYHLGAELTVGVTVAFCAGFFALWALRRVLLARRFSYFAFYCWTLGLSSLAYLLR